MNHYRHWGLNALSKGLARVLPRSGSQKQSGNSWTHLAVFSVFATLLLAVPQTTLAQVVSFGHSTYTATEEGEAVTVTVSLSEVAAADLSIGITTTPSSGSFQVDGLTSNALDILAGERSNTFTVMATEDNSDLNDHTVTLSFSTPLPTGVTITGSTNPTATLNLVDNDRETLAVYFTAGSYVATENGSAATVTVSVEPAADRPLTIGIMDEADQGTEATDYTVSPIVVTFALGDTTANQTITVTALEDGDADNEGVTLSFIDLPVDVTTRLYTTTNVTLQDDGVKPLVVSFAKNKYQATENPDPADLDYTGDDVEVTVMLNEMSDRVLVIPIAATGTTGTYSLSATRVDFRAGEQTKTITVTASDDTNLTDDNVVLSFGTLPRNVDEGSQNTTTVALLDSDRKQLEVSFASSGYTANEEDGNVVTVMVTLSESADRGVTIPITTTSQDADFELGGVDLTIDQTLEFSSSDMSKTFTIRALDDLDVLDDFVTLGFGKLPQDVTTGTQPTASVTLKDDRRTAYLVTFGNVAYTALEEGSAVNVRVSLDKSADRQLVIPITSVGSSGASFALSAASVTIPPGDQSREITITANADDGNKVDETVMLSFDTANLPADVSEGTPATSTVTLKDNDRTQLTVSFPSAKYTATELGNPATVTVSVNPAADRTIVIPITTSPEEGDFQLSATTVTIAANSTSGTVDVTALKDVDTANETVELGFGALPQDVSAGSRSTTTVTLKDDEQAKLTVSFGAAAYSATEEGAAAKVMVNLSGNAPGALTIPITVLTAGTGATVPANVTIAKNKQSATFDVTKLSNDGNFDDEEVTLTFGALPDNVVAGSLTETTVTLVDDDRLSLTAYFGGATYSAMEGGSGATVTVRLNQAPARPSVAIPIIPESQSTDFQLVDDMGMELTELVFTSSDMSKTFIVIATDDEDVADDMVQLMFGDLPADVRAGSPSSATVRLVDDLEGKWAVSFGTTSYTATEGGEAATVAVLLSQRAIRELTIPIEPTPTNAGFFSLSSREAVFSPGERSYTITVTATDDVDKEDNEVTLNFGALPEDVLLDSQAEATVTLVDEDLDDLEVSFDKATYTATEGGTSATVKVNLNQAADRQVAIPITTDPNEGDFELSATELVFYAGATSQTITVKATPDVDINDESVTLGFGEFPRGVSASASSSTTSVTLSDDGIKTLSVSFDQETYTAYEGASDGTEEVTVTVNLSDVADREVTIPISVPTSGGFSVAPEEVVIPRNSQSGTFTVTAENDSDRDDNTVVLGIGQLQDKVSKSAPNSTTVTLVDDDRNALTVAYVLATNTAVEEGADATVKVMLSATSDRTIVIPITTNPPDGDFELSATEVEISAGQIDAMFFVTATDDADVLDETVTLGFPDDDDLPAEVTTGLQDTSVVTLQDDQRTSLTVSFGAATYSATEAKTAGDDDAEVEVTVMLNNTSDRSLVIPISNTTTGSVTGVVANVNIPSNEQSASFTITDILDADPDDDVIELSIGDLSLLPDVSKGTPSATTVTILDSNRQALTVAFDAATYDAKEGGPGVIDGSDVTTVTVNLTLPSGETTLDRAVTIPITANPAEGDFELSATEVAFALNATPPLTATFTVTATNDPDEVNDTVRLGFDTLPTGVSVGSQSSTAVTLTDDRQKALAVTFGSDSYTATEGGAAAMVAVNLNPAADRPVTIPINSTPITGSDFAVPSPAEVVFTAGQSTAMFEVNASNDANIDDGKVDLTFGDLPHKVSVGTQSSTGVMLVDDDREQLIVSFVEPSADESYFAVENGDPAAVMLSLDSAADREVRVPIIASSASQAFVMEGVVVFEPGDRTQELVVTALDDPDQENDMVTLSLGNLPVDVSAGELSSTLVTLSDDTQTKLIVSFDQATYSAKEQDGAGVEVMVNLSEMADRPIRILLTTESEKQNFTLSETLVMFAVGDNSKSFTVYATNDNDLVDDTVVVGLADFPDDVLGGMQSTTTVTLVDNDRTTLMVSFDADSYRATEGDDDIVITVRLNEESDRVVKVPIIATGDFELPEIMVTFAKDQDVQTFTIPASQDDNKLDDTIELAFGELPADVSADMAAATTMVTVVDDDRDALVVSFAAAEYMAIEEGDPVAVTVRLDPAADRPVTIRITAEPETGPFSLSAMEVSFLEGNTEMMIEVTATDDVNTEDDWVMLAFGELPADVSADMAAETTTVTLQDDGRAALVVSFAATEYTAIEQGEAAMVTVRLNEMSDRDVIIPITTTSESTDFNLVGLTDNMEVVFAAGDQEMSFTVEATDDMDTDPDMVTLAIGDELPPDVSKGDQGTATVNLQDDGRAALVVSFAAAEYTATEGGAAATVMVSLNVASDRDVTIQISTDPLEGDFELSAMEVMFAAGEMSKEIIVTALLDDDVDDDMVTLGFDALPADVTEGMPSAATVTLMDDGLLTLAVSFGAAEYWATEDGENATVTVSLSEPSDRDVTIRILTNPETGDFDLDVTEVAFAEGDQEMLITVTALGDDDVDDEMVELAFGELPLKVNSSDPSTAMVTLVDKGYTVTFAQARYSIRESERGTVTANISPSANGQVSIPLSVTHQGGATANDYSGVPGSLAFAGGSNQATFTVSVMADEENDPGESIDVSFGTLPDKVNAGDLAMTTVEFEQFRTAEQFSQTLRAALAVVAGSMGDSAISAIETRFERYRESMGSGGSSALRNSEPTYGHWSDMESPGLAISGYQGAGGMDDGFAPMATKTPGTGLTTGFSRGYRNLTSGSLSDNISLGALASTARPGESVIASGYGGVSGANREQDVSFSGVAFEMAMEHGDEGKFSPVVWVQGDMQSFDGNLENIGMDFDGGLNALHLGVDLYANGQTLAGVSMMQSWGDLDYTDDGVDGNFDSSMSTFHPYIYFQANENLGVWGILGFGSGSVDMSEPDRTHEFDADFSMFAGGVRSVLNRRDNNELGLSADAFTAELSTNAADDIPGVKGEAQRARVMVDWLQNKTMEEGQQLAWKAEIGGRFDGGDGIEGVGIEGGFRVGLLDNNSGLDLALTGRALLLHENDFSDWGIGVQATWDPGEKREGLVASVASSFGQDRGGSTSLWDNGDTIMRPVGMDAMWMDSQYRMDGEVGYAGIRTPLGLPGTVMPYSRARWSGYGQEFGVGTRWMPAASENNLLPATFELEGLSRETRTGLTDLAVLLRMSIPFGGSKAIVPSRNHVSARQVSAATGPTIQPVSSSRQDANSTSESTKAE